MIVTTSKTNSLMSEQPEVTDIDALAILRSHWGITGGLTRFGSERDMNYRVRTDVQDYVLKIANRSEPFLVTDFQTKALLHLEANAPSLQVPKVVRARDGATQIRTQHGTARVLSYLPGDLMNMAAPSQRLGQAVGTVAAQLSKGLAGFSHPAEHHFLQWDLKNAGSLRPFLNDISDPELRAAANSALDHFDTDVQPALAKCRAQVVHNDLNPHNVLVSPVDHGIVCGVIDFGDMVNTPLVCDLAIAAAYQIDINNLEQSIVNVVESYYLELPMTKHELSLVYDLIMMRSVTTLAIASHRAAKFPQNTAYILRNFAAARAGFLALGATNRDDFTYLLTQRCLTRIT